MSKRPRDLEREALTYTAKPIRRIVLSFHDDEYKRVLDKLDEVMRAARVDTHTEAVLHLLGCREGLDD